MKGSNVMVKGCFISALVMMGANAYASSNASTVITGDVLEATCELEATTSVDLGNWAISDFKNGAGSVTEAKDLVLGISGCQGALKGGDKISVVINGQNLPGFPSVFGKTGVKSDVGVELKTEKGDVIANHGTVEIASMPADAPADADAAGFDGKVAVLKAALYSTVDKPTVQHVEAPINFNLKYN